MWLNSWLLLMQVQERTASRHGKSNRKAPPSDSVLYEKQRPCWGDYLKPSERYNAVLPEVTDRLIELIKTVQEDTQVKALCLPEQERDFVQVRTCRILIMPHPKNSAKG